MNQVENTTNSVISATEVITPEAASEMLSCPPATDIKQRRISDLHVDAMVRDIKNGEWVNNGESIIIAPSGFVLDGQHRLTAVVRSKTPIEATVVRGVPEYMLPKIGVGKKRSGADVLEMHGYKNAKMLASILQKLHRYYVLGLLSRDGRNENGLREYEYLSAVNKYPGAIQAASYAGNHHVKWLRGAIMGTMWYITGEIDPNDRNDFFGSLISGEGLEQGSPILSLRERLFSIALQKETRGFSNTFYGESQTMALFVKAWNAYREGRLVKNLYFRNGEDFPRPI